MSIYAPTLHTHAYGDHDHPEHHHGLAVHDHQRLDHHAAESTARVEGCDPGRHAIAISFGCLPPPQALTVDAVDAMLAVIGPDLTTDARVSLTEVRAHSPPLHKRTSPRAPPSDLTHPII